MASGACNNTSLWIAVKRLMAGGPCHRVTHARRSDVAMVMQDAILLPLGTGTPCYRYKIFNFMSSLLTAVSRNSTISSVSLGQVASQVKDMLEYKNKFLRA